MNQAAAITSDASTTFTIGNAGSFTVTSTGYPTAALSETGALPSGVTFTDNGDGTGTLPGTPAAGSGGVYTVTLTAINGVGTAAKQSFTLSVNEPTAITSGFEHDLHGGQCRQLHGDHDGLPDSGHHGERQPASGVTLVDNGDNTATLSGTPAAGSGGSYPFTIKAINGIGSAATPGLLLDGATRVRPSLRPTRRPSRRRSSTSSRRRRPDLRRRRSPNGATCRRASSSATGSSPASRAKKGTYQVLLTASNGVGSNATQIFTLNVVPLGVTTTSLPDATEGTPYSQQLTAQGGLPPYKWKATAASLPSGLTLSKTGLLSGTIPSTVTTGNHTINVTVTDKSSPVQKATASLTLNVQAGS